MLRVGEMASLVSALKPESKCVGFGNDDEGSVVKPYLDVCQWQKIGSL